MNEAIPVDFQSVLLLVDVANAALSFTITYATSMDTGSTSSSDDSDDESESNATFLSASLFLWVVCI
eukprot:CAMPEP_0170550360 /NCGR_PEP_ID=MMETSP0211-20121228/8421_1 /TAXON_ID=311385 /ORGANISM="Pseudokeronopsis sp., Strain OXSARD2" /LENGTH=66 /DNA_ID=CAMNT_0010856863 /DNA_START=445 /DNA_END=642 /DNA_ORIENTATION=+